MTNLLVRHPGCKPLTPSRIRSASREDLASLRIAFQLFEHLTREAPFTSLSHLQDHSLRLLNNLQVIAGRAGDLEILQPAIVLHDIGLFYSQDSCHGAKSARIIRPYLSDLCLSSSKQDRLCSAVRAHDDPTHIDNSPEAKALRVLDALDAFGEIGLYRYLEINTRRGLRPPELFDAPLRSMVARRHNLPLHWFSIEDQRDINSAYEFTFTTMRRMGSVSKGIQENNGELMLLAGLQKIRWDLIRIGELLSDGKIRENSFVRGFFEALQAQFPREKTF